jgi:hypothetical protein
MKKGTPGEGDFSFAPPERKAKKKGFTLFLIQTAWVAEVAAVVLYTMIAVPLLENERVNLWLTALPVLTAIIGGQGAAASVGPLLADKFKRGGEG